MSSESVAMTRDEELLWKLSRVRGGQVLRSQPLLTSEDHHYLVERYEELVRRERVWDRVGELVLQAEGCKGIQELFLRLGEAGRKVRELGGSRCSGS